MNTIDLTTLIPRCHEAAKAKGFWDVMPNPGQMLMLAISELSEALEAHRKDYRASVRDFNIEAATDPALDIVERRAVEARAFVNNIKDTVEDELADAYIRLCDFAGGYGLDVDIIAEGVVYDRAMYYEPSPYNNFGCDLLDATRRVVAISDDNDAADIPYTELAVRRALTELENICEQHGIDLATHIELKLAYNATRPVRHGKNY